jgi:hypothetical protein
MSSGGVSTVANSTKLPAGAVMIVSIGITKSPGAATAALAAIASSMIAAEKILTRRFMRWVIPS